MRLSGFQREKWARGISFGRQCVMILVIFFQILVAKNSSAQVHEPGLRWRVLETVHFSLIYPEQYSKIATQAAQICEEVYLEIGSSLGFFPGKTQVVLHTRTDYANGFVSPIPWRMELFIPEPPGDWLGSGDQWLRVLIAHEFTHVVHLRMRKGLSALTRPLFGELNAFWQGLTPHWFIEGLPTLNETRFTRGGRGRNAYHWMQFAATLRGGAPWPLENTNYISRKQLPLGMYYVAGYFLSQLATQEFQRDVWTKTLQRYAAWPVFGLGWAFKKETGVSLDALYRQALQIQSEFLRQSQTGRQQIKVIRPVHRPEQQYFVRWLGRDKLVAYIESFDELPGIFEISADGASRRLLTRRLTNNRAGFAIGKDKIFWSEIVQNPRYEATQLADLFVKDLKTGRLTRLTRGARLYDLDLHPNGRLLTAIQTRLPGNQVVTIDLEEAKMDTLLFLQGQSLFAPRWSPDGNQLALAVRDSAGGQNIAVYNPALDSLFYPFGRNRFHDASPCWEASGRFLLFSSDRSGRFNIWAGDPSSGKLWMVTDSEFGAFAPDVSPDGRKIAFVEYTPFGFRAAEIPFNPASWTPAGFVTRVLPPGLMPRDAVRATGGSKAQGSFAVHAYWQTLIVGLVPHGWFPLLLSGESGWMPGMFLISEDPLHRVSYQAIASVDTRTRQLNHDFSFRFAPFWPALWLRSYNLPDHTNVANGEYWFRKRGATARLEFPLHLQRNAYTTEALISSGLEWEDADYGGFGTRYRGSLLYAYLQHSGASLRDLYPHFSFSLAAFQRSSLPGLASDFKGGQAGLLAQTFLPLPVRHHAAQVMFAAEKRQGNYGYSFSWALPVGFKDTGGKQMWRTRLGYYFPIAYLETPLPLIPGYLDYLGGGLFFDGFLKQGPTSGASDQYSSAYSAGVQLHLGSYWFHNLPVRLAASVFYQSLERRWKKQISVGMPLSLGVGLFSGFFSRFWDWSSQRIPDPALLSP